MYGIIALCQRIEELYIRKWTDEINSQKKLTYYVKFKCNFERELNIAVLGDIKKSFVKI